MSQNDKRTPRGEKDVSGTRPSPLPSDWHDHGVINALTARPIRHTHKDGSEPHEHEPLWGMSE